MPPYISPEWLEIEKDMGYRVVLSGSFENYQKGGQTIGQYIVAHLPPREEDGLHIEDRSINQAVVVRIYRPKVAKIAPPIGVFSHGGGFCEGSIDMEDGLCRTIASKYSCVIVSVEYRRAPASEIHTIFQDALDAFTWTFDNASGIGGDQQKMFMFGSSAGGSLSLGTAHKLIELGRKGQLRGVMNLAGGTVHERNVPSHLRHLYKSMEENAENVPIIDRESTRIINATAGLDANAGDPWIYPLLSQHLRDFPSTYLVACGADPLRDDNVALLSELRSHGVTAKLDMYEGLPHVFWMFPTLKSSRTFMDNLLTGIKFILGRE